MNNNSKYKCISENYITGIGELTGYVGIFKPSKKFDNYSVNIILTVEEGEALLEKVKEIQIAQQEEYGKNKKLEDITVLQYADRNKYDEQGRIVGQEGVYILRAGLKANSMDGHPTKEVVVLDSQNNLITDAPAGEGTMARLKVLLMGYSFGSKVGVSAKLQAVQIIKLVEYATEEKNGGFDKVKGGYVCQTAAPTAPEVQPQKELDF